MNTLKQPQTPNSALPGCAQCRKGAYGGAWPPPQRIAVNGDGPTYLHQCGVCGALWQFDMRFANPISEEKARQLYPAHFADWSPRGSMAGLPQRVSGAAFPPTHHPYPWGNPPESDLERALTAAKADEAQRAVLRPILRESLLQVPSTSEPAADGSGMTPLALNRPPTVWILAFTRLILAQRFAGDAPYCLGFAGSDLIARLPDNFGLCLNYGAGSEFLVGPQELSRVNE